MMDLTTKKLHLISIPFSVDNDTLDDLKKLLQKWCRVNFHETIKIFADGYEIIYFPDLHCIKLKDFINGKAVFTAQLHNVNHFKEQIKSKTHDKNDIVFDQVMKAIDVHKNLQDKRIETDNFICKFWNGNMISTINFDNYKNRFMAELNEQIIIINNQNSYTSQSLLKTHHHCINYIKNALNCIGLQTDMKRYPFCLFHTNHMVEYLTNCLSVTMLMKLINIGKLIISTQICNGVRVCIISNTFNISNICIISNTLNISNICIISNS